MIGALDTPYKAEIGLEVGIVTPHAQRERGKVIDRGVHILYIYSILHILTIVFPGTRTVEYQPIFHGVT